MTHICIDNLTILGSDNGLSPGRSQAIIWTNAGKLLIGPLGTNFSEILIEIQTFSLKKICLKMSSAKCCSFRLGLNVLTEKELISCILYEPNVDYVRYDKHISLKFPHGPLTRYVKLRVAHAPGMPGTFSPPPRNSDPDMHHGTCRDACWDR